MWYIEVLIMGFLTVIAATIIDFIIPPVEVSISFYSTLIYIIGIFIMGVLIRKGE